MQNLVPGQRWINTLETQLGLGTVLKTEYRSVTILFNASRETRTYAKQSAPLIRVRFSPGDTIRSQQGNELTVQSLVERKGLITYIGADREGRRIEMHESELDNFVRLDRPADRLFSGQIDPDKWLELRYQTLLRQNALITSQLRGLTGCRTSLIPHQLYIAHEVARRFAPRVLLADEVGLGKTIEAGLILHQQLITERAERVLIVVPESLVHQWLVEMIRRFNLFFSIFDESRCFAVR
ncbi:MAG: SNF2-related protein [Methylococcales bacterium]